MTAQQLCPAIYGAPGGVGWPVEQFGPYEISWDGIGKIWIASNQEGTGTIMVDDRYLLTVTNSTGTKSREEDMAGPYRGVPQPPRDVTYLFAPGTNTMTFKTWSTICCYYGHTPFWVVTDSGIIPKKPCVVDIKL